MKGMLLECGERSRKAVFGRDIYTFGDVGFQANGQTLTK